MIGRFWERWQCRYISPLLVPFSESELDERTRSRVLSHLDHCESCRTELAELVAMGDFFRANPPAAASAPVDLWARLEAQITTTAPVAQRERPLLSHASPASQWRSFFVAFAQASPVVAVVVLGALFGMNQLRPALTAKQTDRVSFGSAVANNSRVTILLPKPARKTVARAKSVQIARAVKPALSSAKRKASRPATRMLVAQNRVRSHPAVTPVVLTKANAPVMVALAKPVTRPMVHEAAKESIAGLRMVAMADISRNVPVGPSSDAPVALRDREAIQPVSWDADDNESVAADTAVDTATDLHRQQTLFSYGRR